MLNERDWNERKLKEFNNSDWDLDILPLIRRCLKIANQDTEQILPYTDLVLLNIRHITNMDEMSVTFNQWKCFNAYFHQNTKLRIKEERLY